MKKSGEREKDKTLVDKKSTSGGIPAPLSFPPLFDAERIVSTPPKRVTTTHTKSKNGDDERGVHTVDGYFSSSLVY